MESRQFYLMRKIRIILWSGLGVAVFILLWLKFVPAGNITYTYKPGKDNEFITQLTPEERVKEEKGEVKVTGDPVYFTLRTPRGFERGEMEVIYQAQGKGTSLIEWGPLVDDTNWRYRLKPVQNRVLDRLSLVWNKERDGREMLLQENKEYGSLKEFLKDPPSSREFGLYNKDLDRKYILKEYTPSSNERTIPIKLRGTHQFYTYIKEEPLDISMRLWDINKNKEEEKIYLDVYYRDKLIQSRPIEGDGVSQATKEINDLGVHDIHLEDMAEGVYKIELRANDDVVISDLTTSQQKLSFPYKIRIASSNILSSTREVGSNVEKDTLYPIDLYSNNSSLGVKTIYPDSLHTIELDGKKMEDLEIKETYKKFVASLNSGKNSTSTRIMVKKGGITLTGDGVFSFSPSSLLDPGFQRVTSPEDIHKELNYILADYSSPQKWRGEWKKRTTVFDLEGAYAEKKDFPRIAGKYKFLISVPGLEEKGGEMRIKKIKVRLKGKSVWEKLGITNELR